MILYQSVSSSNPLNNSSKNMFIFNYGIVLLKFQGLHINLGCKREN